MGLNGFVENNWLTEKSKGVDVLKRKSLLVLLLIIITVTATGALVSAQQRKAFTVFMGEALPDYPGSTIVGDIIDKETGVKLQREYLVGDLETKVGLMIASGELPDMLMAAHFTSLFKDAGLLIPLNDLVEKHAPNIKRLYAKHWEQLKQEDGNVYWLPIQATPYGTDSSRYPELGFFINKKVLKEAGWPVIKTLDQYFDLIENYVKKHPTQNGGKTIGYVTLFDSWRSFATTNVPQHLMGYPNEGEFVPVLEDGKYIVRQYHTSYAAKAYYKKLNEMYNKGIVDKETFVMNYDQYIEKLSSGRVLGTFNQYWQLQEAQEILLRDDPESIFIPFPVVVDEMVEEYQRDIPYIQATQGMAITTACKDPVAAIKYLDYLIREETQHLIQWGIKGVHYEVDANGHFYRTEAQIKMFLDPDWVRDVFGRQYYYNSFPNLRGIDEDGNSFMPDRQPNLIYADSQPTEKEAMDAYGVKAFSELYNTPIDKKYYPLWTVTVPAGSPAHIEQTRMKDILNGYVPKLVMSKPNSFEKVWDDYVKDISGLMKEQIKVYQEQIDWRMENW
ncbi:MAG TPA: ABC transporter substrate-binding protein [Firmicutes bacterium]|nr:ABC transporter substrate-binding protein [Bacillota bacterium]